MSGPVSEPDPQGVRVVHVESAQEMLAACRAALPADVAVCAAAVADWRVRTPASQKLKKDKTSAKSAPPTLDLVENPDILATLSAGNDRPKLVIGFAAETETLIEGARAKLLSKGCDWIVANDVSPQSGVLGGSDNTVHLVKRDGVESWPRMSKDAVAEQLAQRIRDHLLAVA